MKVFALLLLALFVAQVSAGVLFTRTVVPQGWTKDVVAPSNARVSFMMALKQQNLDALEAKFWAVSDPENDDYQNFLTIEQINAMVAPPKATHDEIVYWLQAHGVMPQNIKSFGDAIEVVTTAHIASRLFNTKFHVFTHKESGKKAVKAWGSYSLPSNIHQHVDFVEGISSFPMPHFTVKHVGLNNAQNEIVIPQTVNLLYSIPTLNPGSSPSTSQGVIEYEDQYFTNDDLVIFGQTVGVSGIANVTSAHIVGQNDPTQPQTESSLDIQMVASINTESTSWFWIEGDNVWQYGFAVHFTNTADVPAITSTSYGWWEGDQCEDGIGGAECQQLGVDTNGYVERVNTEFQKIGVKGATLLISSGDSGANGRTNGDCSIPQLRAAFPSSSPYVTSVGATEWRNATYNLPNAPAICQSTYSCVSGGVECAVSIDISGFASGGGFSNISTRPSYQDAAVTAYLNSGVQLPPSSYYNAKGRGAPDVSAVGHNGLIIQQGQQEVVGGTSMSSPIFAAIVALLSESYIKKTGNNFGFLNPLLYQIYASNPEVFTDITIGDNICTEDGCSQGCQGFYATKGWDPVTGLGTPRYDAMLKAIDAVADKVVARRAAKNQQ
jgi:subtilase family serine protease